MIRRISKEAAELQATSLAETLVEKIGQLQPSLRAQRQAPVGPRLGLARSSHLLSLCSGVQVWAMGFGTVTTFSLMWTGGDYGPGPHIVKSLLGAVILVNIPQLILSLNYFVPNGCLTCMLATDEWSRFSIEQKGLRVTTPTGEQRSTYFLQIPYRFAIPLISFSALLHWLVSQSFFLAKIIALEDGEENLNNSTTVFRFSAMAIMFTLITGLVLFFGVLCLGLRLYDGSIPLGPSCSAVISAACHPTPGEGNIASRKIQWGVVKVDEFGIGHCAFTSEEAGDLVPGRLYLSRARAWHH